MLIYAVDDEPNMLYLLHEAIAEAAPDAEILDFFLAVDALAYMKANNSLPDVVFSDIQMPGINGMDFAVKLKALSPQTKLIFVTGYDYAMDAYRLHVSGYILKPVEAERIREELEILFPKNPEAVNRLKIQCFGTFEVFWQNQPLAFARKQTKELLAYLVDRRGALCSSDDIIAALWEDSLDFRNAKHRVWNLTSDLRTTLKTIGMENVLITRGKQLAVRMDLLDCDYYKMLSGDLSVNNTFRGEYMEQYSWAEPTKANLIFKNRNDR